MRGTDCALLDQLGRLTGGVAVLRPQDTPANLPDLSTFVSGLPGLIDDKTGITPPGIDLGPTEQS